MADRKLYHEDPARTRVETEIVDAGEEEGRPWVRLAATVFYPEGGDRIARRLPDATPELLRRVAGAATAARAGATVVLVGGGEGEACFLVSAGANGPADVSAEGARIRDALDARGGGRGRMFQGTGGTWREGLL